MTAPALSSTTIERLVLRRLVDRICEKEAHTIDSLTRVRPSEKAPHELSNEECCLLLAIKHVVDAYEFDVADYPDFVSARNIHCTSLDPQTHFLTPADGLRLNLEELRHRELIKDSQIGFFELSDLLDQFIADLKESSLAKPVSELAREVWLEWFAEYRRLHSMESIVRARRFLSAEISKFIAQSENSSETSLKSGTAIFDDFANEVAKQLPRGKAAPIFRFLLKHRKVTFREFQDGVDPETDKLLTTSSNAASIASMLRKHSRDLQHVSKNQLRIIVEEDRQLITLEVSKRGKANFNGNSDSN